jgi:hypothetical protein
VTVYAQRCREAYPGSVVIVGSIEASLRRIAHYDYWSDKVRRSVLPDSKADMLFFGNAERAIVEFAHRLAKGEKIGEIRDLRGTAFMVPTGWLPSDDWDAMDSTEVDTRAHWSACRSLCHGYRPARHLLATPKRRPAAAADPHRVPHRAPGCPQGPSRPHRCPPAILRAGQGRPGALRPRLAHLPPRIQPRQRPGAGAGAWRTRCLAQSAAFPADHRRDRCGLRIALRPPAAPSYGEAKIPAWE